MTTELNGFYEDMTYEDYAKVDALNGSKIIHMRRSPMKYKHNIDNPPPPSPAMILGTATHRLILEPGLANEFAIWGMKDSQKVRNGRVWDEFKADNAGKVIVTRNECLAMVGMAVGARKNAPIRKYAGAAGPTEVSMFWQHPHTKRRFKARLDKVIPETHTILDLKTTRDSRDFRFGPQAYQLGYVVKMALYWYGYKTLLGVEPSIKLGAIESKGPFESAVYNVPRDLIMLGVEELDDLVSRITECEKADEWPASQQTEVDLVMPPWASTEAETELDLEMV